MICVLRMNLIIEPSGGVYINLRPGYPRDFTWGDPINAKRE